MSKHLPESMQEFLVLGVRGFLTHQHPGLCTYQYHILTLYVYLCSNSTTTVWGWAPLKLHLYPISPHIPQSSPTLNPIMLPINSQCQTLGSFPNQILNHLHHMENILLCQQGASPLLKNCQTQRYPS